MLAFYFTIANISRCLQSKKDVIQVVAIWNSNNVKTHGLQAVADVIFDDIQVLEQQSPFKSVNAWQPCLHCL